MWCLSDAGSAITHIHRLTSCKLLIPQQTLEPPFILIPCTTYFRFPRGVRSHSTLRACCARNEERMSFIAVVVRELSTVSNACACTRVSYGNWLNHSDLPSNTQLRDRSTRETHGLCRKELPSGIIKIDGKVDLFRGLDLQQSKPTMRFDQTMYWSK
jgi:hypothetical protein